MIVQDEDMLICDFAETYHIYDYKALPLQYAATLAAGLRDDSRIKMQMKRERVNTNILLEAMIFDKLSLLVWLNSTDGAKGINRPEEITPKLTGRLEEKEVFIFENGEEFEELRERILRGDN